MALFALLVLFLLAEYVWIGPDPWTGATKQGVRSGFEAGREAYQADRTPSKGSGPVGRSGSKGTGPRTGPTLKQAAESARAGATKARAGSRRLRFWGAVLAAAWNGFGAGFQASLVAHKATQEPPAPSPEAPPPTKETDMEIDTSPQSVAEYTTPSDISSDTEILAQFSQAMIDAAIAYNEFVAEMVGRYEGGPFETELLTQAFAALAETGEDGWAAAHELIPEIDEAIAEAVTLGQEVARVGAAGDTESFKEA